MMHSPIMMLGMLMWITGLPLFAMYLIIFFISLFFKKTRIYCKKLIIRSFLFGFSCAVAIIAIAQSNLPKPYNYQIGIPAFTFGFSIFGFIYSIYLLIQALRKKMP